MNAPATRALTPARVVAVVLVALVAVGLAYLRVTSGDDSVSVPAGAQAGDLVLERCDYGTDDGTFAADCGTLVVPENRADPRSRLIALPVTRIRARSQSPREPLFRLEGGPGLTNMTFPFAGRFAADRDVVLVGYRGVDGSSVLDCPEVESALERSTDFLGQKSFRAYADGYRSCAARLTGDGVDLAGYSLAQRVDDLEAARVALGYDRIDLVSESAGTRTAMIYAWRHPRSIHRSVMIGVNPPGHYLWDGRTTDRQLARYGELCAQDESCRGRTDDLAASLRWTAAHIPDRWWFLPVQEANVRIASFFGLFETTPELAPVNAPLTLDSWLSAAEGDAGGLWFSSLAGDLVFPRMFVWGEYAATGVQDARVADAYFAAGGDHGSILGNAGTDFAWGGGLLADAWPASPDDAAYGRVRPSDVETLLVGGELDFSTPAEVATRELLPHLPNGHQVVLAGFGHSGSFWNDQPEAGTRLVTAFLDSGRVDDSLYQTQRVDFTPSFSQSAIAKIVLGSLLGLAALTVLSLLLIALRVRWRGTFGRVGGVALRAVYALVLGIGGWCLGALIVLTAIPGVAVDDELVTALSAGVPVGLGVYLAWVNRDWSARTKVAGFAVAAAGALVGARLGYAAGDGLVALLTAVAGSVAGANLALLVLDGAWDAQARDRFAAASAKETLRASPTAG